MNRKLHNTVMAMIASSSLFVLGLLTATPTVPAFSPDSASAVVDSIDTDNAVVADAVDDSVEQAEAAPRRHARRARQQSVAMPFFSFAPRG
ncbi:MAG: hypothetical protein EOP93_01320 [Lysobacteraceae bacterium]|nr:MAG: hypothetical protein EOP93_01320 [Xanthomonadaceae bacterium]